MGFLIVIEKRDKVALSTRMETTFSHEFSVKDDDPVLKEIARLFGLDCRSNEWTKRLGERTGMRFLTDDFFSVMDAVGAHGLAEVFGNFRNVPYASVHIKLKREYNTIRKIIARGDAIEGEPFLEALVEFANDNTSWEGTATDLLRNLNRFATPAVRKSSMWPAGGGALSLRMSMFRAQLQQRGITFEKRRNMARRIIAMCKENVR